MVLNSESEKLELERYRRWYVKIDDIYILPYDMFDAFVQFTIGGDYKVEHFDIPRKNKKLKVHTGKRGYTDCTEVLENLKIECKERFDKCICIEVRDSIINLMRQYLIIEVWDYNTIQLNEFQGMAMIKLMNIISGNIYQSVIIEKKSSTGVKKPICKIDFKIIFQEIWDFRISFEDWGIKNVNYLFHKSEDWSHKSSGIAFTFDNLGEIARSSNDTKGEMYYFLTLVIRNGQNLTKF